MSELIKSRCIRDAIKKELLVTVSSAALSLIFFDVGAAQADDSDKPIVWIELDGQLEAATGMERPIYPEFFSINAPAIKTIKQARQVGRPYIFGNEGAISFQPEDSDWVFSGSIRIGRANGKNHIHHESKVGPWYHHTVTYYGKGNAYFFTPTFQNTSDMASNFSRSHLIVDFQAGKDVGLGLFGRESSSNIAMGVRFAQFASKADILIRARPDVRYHFNTFLLPYKLPIAFFSNYVEGSTAVRHFHGVGPSLSIKETLPLIGEAKAGEIAFDGGVNAAALFGRQQARIQHHSAEYFRNGAVPYHGHPGGYSTVYQNSASPPQRSRMIVVPNIGASAAITYRVENFKVSAGYRADFFFGAMDTGIDVAKKSNASFYGPFASISVGLGG
jgi:hypothetical protein